uniref:Secreted protein n=1 Tax=Macrostomum lignano TaxID=282301 RepID=A0A1I8JPV5_9PLAT
MFISFACLSIRITRVTKSLPLRIAAQAETRFEHRHLRTDRSPTVSLRDAPGLCRLPLLSQAAFCRTPDRQRAQYLIMCFTREFMCCHIGIGCDSEPEEAAATNSEAGRARAVEQVESRPMSQRCKRVQPQFCSDEALRVRVSRGRPEL